MYIYIYIYTYIYKHPAVNRTWSRKIHHQNVTIIEHPKICKHKTHVSIYWIQFFHQKDSLKAHCTLPQVKWITRYNKWILVSTNGLLAASGDGSKAMKLLALEAGSAAAVEATSRKLRQPHHPCR